MRNLAFPYTEEDAKWFLEHQNKLHPNIPPYYSTMYLDGFEPWQIMIAQKKKFFTDYLDRLAAYEEAKSDPLDDVRLTFKSEVKIKK